MQNRQVYPRRRPAPSCCYARVVHTSDGGVGVIVSEDQGTVEGEARQELTEEVRGGPARGLDEDLAQVRDEVGADEGTGREELESFVGFVGVWSFGAKLVEKRVYVPSWSLYWRLARLKILGR